MGNVKLAALAAATLLGGCAQQIFNAAQKDCAAFGFRPGSTEFAQCTQDRYGARQAQIQNSAARLQSAGVAMNGTSAPQSGQPVAFLTGQFVEGQSRVCTYNRMGSPFAMTVGAADVCPISVP